MYVLFVMVIMCTCVLYTFFFEIESCQNKMAYDTTSRISHCGKYTCVIKKVTSVKSHVYIKYVLHCSTSRVARFFAHGITKLCRSQEKPSQNCFVLAQFVILKKCFQFGSWQF